MDGFEVARRLLAESPAPAVVLTSGRNPGDYGPRLAECQGIAGFLPKVDVCGAKLVALLDDSFGGGS